MSGFLRMSKRKKVLIIGQKATTPKAIGVAYRTVVDSLNTEQLPSLASIGNASFTWTSRRTKDEDLAMVDQQITAFSDQWRISPENAEAVEALLLRLSNQATRKGKHLLWRPAVFGSRVYGIARDTSDVDICLHIRQTVTNAKKGGGKRASRITQKTTDRSRIKILMSLSAWMRKKTIQNGHKENVGQFQNVTMITKARVPIIKFNYAVPGSSGAVLSCDVSSSGGTDGVRKSKLLETYIAIDPRVRPILVVLKAWAKQRSLSDSRSVNSFGFMMLGLAFLIRERVVPPLQLLLTCKIDSNGWDNLQALQSDSNAMLGLLKNVATIKCIQSSRTIGEQKIPSTKASKHFNAHFLSDTHVLEKWKSPNSKPVIQLLFEMFQLYGCSFDPLKHVVSVRFGSPLLAREPRADQVRETLLPSNKDLADPKNWPTRVKPLVVEDPFDPGINCARQATCEWTDGMLWEMRRAAWIIHNHGSDSGIAANVLDKLLAPPSLDIYVQPKAWASAYLRFQPIYEQVTGKRVGPGMREIDLGAVVETETSMHQSSCGEDMA
ncbi:hypothetical protein EV175_004761 [Coemansia sp. RSA 1933]|nr:hypothetical protein EV175_004761 [Coemansia sp. RSA 1933]